MGNLLQIHCSTVRFDKKSTIIADAGELNDIRQALAHRLLQHYSEKDILIQSDPAKDVFLRLFENWRKAMTWFYKQIDRLKETEEVAVLT